MSVVQTDMHVSAVAKTAAARLPEAPSRCVPAREDLSLPAVLGALSDPMRLRVVAELAAAGEGGELACKAFDLPVVKSTCTHHFRVLREAGVISQRVVGTTRLNALRREDLEARFPGLLDAVLGAASWRGRSHA